METDEREDQALQILDQVVETPTKKSMKNNIPLISIKFFPGLWIRINLSCWFRIQEGKNPGGKKVEKFHVLNCWMFSFEGLRLLL